MDDTPELPEGLLETLIDIGNKTLNDYYHRRGCACDTWPAKCVSWRKPGDMFFGMFDTDAFAIALPDIVPALIGIIIGHLEDDDFLIVNTDEIRDSLNVLLRDKDFPALVLAEESGGNCPDPIECGHEAALGEAESRLEKQREALADALNFARRSSWDELLALVVRKINSLTEQRDDHLKELLAARVTIRGLEESLDTMLKDRNHWRRAADETGKLYSDCENQRDAALEELVRLRAERDTYYGALVAAAPAAARMIRTAFEDNGS